MPARRNPIDLAIVGAGPAGLAAAIAASEQGLQVSVFDEQPSPGGQVYRNIESVAENRTADLDILGEDYWQGYELVQVFRRSGARYIPDTLVWDIGAQGRLSVRSDGQTEQLEAKHILLAGGASERPVPIPGWTLPGVMSAGAVQTLLKTSAIVPDKPVVIAGSGPLLYLIAWQLLQAGVTITALLFTARRFGAALSGLAQALLNGSEYLRKGFAWERALRKAGVPMIDIGALRAHGQDQLEAISYQTNGHWRKLETGLLLVHEGVVPNTQLTMLAGCDHEWNALQHAWQPVCDEWGQSSVDKISIAGDIGGIAGAQAAIHKGRLVVLEIVHQQGRITTANRNRLAYSERAWLRREQKIRHFLDQVFEPGENFRIPADDDTLVCRCEEVSAGEIREVVKLGCAGPNQAKAFTRCGMGPCQGRMCGLTISELIAKERGVPVERVGHYRVRPPLKPLTVAELAGMADME